MTDRKIEHWLEAGRIVAEVLKEVRSLKPGESIVKLCEAIEKSIIKKGAKPAFPANISINEIAAHYAGLPGDLTKIPGSGIIKIDVGAHINGAIADAALSISVGNVSKIMTRLLKAGKEVLEEAIEVVKDGIRVSDISEIIWKKSHELGFGVLEDLGGHSIERWKLHAGIFIPNKPIKGKSIKVRKGQVLAIEPFLVPSSKDGSTRPLWNKTHIFSISEEIKKISDNFLNLLFKKFNHLPFAARWITKRKKDYIKLLNNFIQYNKRGLVYLYPPLLESRGLWVVQFEHTILVKENSAEILTVVN